jgi:hypothetical protein
MEERLFEDVIGNREFGFGLKFDPENTDLAWGQGVLWINGEAAWFQQEEGEEPKPLYWTWVDLLNFLGRNWSWLAYEETYPFHLTPLDPTRLRIEAQKRWENLPESEILDEDEQIFRFERRHNLASGMKGVFLPDVLVLREGKLAWICAERRAYRLPLEQILGVLEQVGERIAAQILKSREPRARRALDLWQARQQTDNEQLLLQLRSGLAAAEISELQQGTTDARAFWEYDAANDDSELLAAARLSAGTLGLDEQRVLLNKIRSLPLVSTPGLDKLSELARTILEKEEIAAHKPFEQGYQLANWLREHLNCTHRFEPEFVLRDWNVVMETVAIDYSALDAVACWGTRHGPAIVLNKGHGTTPCTEHGRRSTLAHEIGHLLMDRHSSLPLAEVLGGATPSWVEQRARAFAAELLLPRSHALNRLKTATVPEDIDQVIEVLIEEFGVSRQLATHQIWNSGAARNLSNRVSSHLGQLYYEAKRL